MIAGKCVMSDTRRPFVLITGMSGAGRGTALHALEDFGYVAVDNVPLPLLGDLMRSTAGSAGELAAPLAFGIDTRTYGFDPLDLVRRVRELRPRPVDAQARGVDQLDQPQLPGALGSRPALPRLAVYGRRVRADRLHHRLGTGAVGGSAGLSSGRGRHRARRV